MMLSLHRILIFCGIIYIVKGARECSDSSKAHLTRCDMYYKCTVMPSGNVVWVPKNCPNGLVYDTSFRNCVIAGDDWECHAENDGRSSSAADDDDDDDENVYGVSNLGYLKEQVKGYGTSEVDDESSIEQQDDDDDERDYMKVENGDFFVTLSQNGTVSFEGNLNSSASTNEIESSGDGELPTDQHGGNLEVKSDYIPLSTSEKLVASQLQRLTQIIKNANNKNGAAATTGDLTPSDLNQFLAMHKLKVKEYHSNKNAVPLPQNKLIEEHHLQQILELQKKLNALAHHRDAYSTQAPPSKYIVTNGHYPPEATTVHINAANALKNPRYPNVGASTSQIVVNRPGGTVVFRLPYSNPPNVEHRPNNEKSENHINPETLKMILEFSKYMSNQAPNTPQFVHSLPPTRNSFLQSNAASVVHSALYKFPWEQFNAQSLAALMNLLQSEKLTNEDDSSSMEKISSVHGNVPVTAHTASEPDDVGPTTIIHNHIPITVANPRPNGPIITRNQIQHQLSVSTTVRPITNDRYDSYGDANHRPLSEFTSAGHNFYAYPNFPNKLHQLSTIATPQQQHHAYSSIVHTQRPNNYNENSFEDRPNYVQIAQSKPNQYNSQNSDATAFGNHAMSPTPTFVSINGGHTNKIYSPYTPQPHLNDANVNDFVSIDEKPYPTFTPSTNYIPIAFASSPKPNYVKPPKLFKRKKKRPSPQRGHVFDKISTFENTNRNNYAEDDDDGYSYDTDDGESNDEASSSEHGTDTNVDQFSSDRSDGNVMDLLANYKSEQLPATAKTATTIQTEEQQQPAYTNQNSRHKQFVSLNGNLMSLETYQQTIEPFLVKDSPSNLQIDVITCATGVRQQNQTDCTRYFVCNEKTGKILSYKCPPYTAFNGDIKLCNGETYTKCFANGGVGDENSHQKLQQLTQLIEMQHEKILHSTPQVKHKQQLLGNGAKATRPIISKQPTSTSAPVQIHKFSETVQKPTAAAATTTHRKQSQANAASSVTKKQKPAAQSAQSTNSNHTLRHKRKISCKKEGKLIDNRSTRHYFLCYKDQTKTMRARLLKCPAKLIFCPSSLVCTSIERCSK